MKWFFSPQPSDQVETEVTQRDQFDNDQVDISDTVVREAIQNSLDAAIDDPAAIQVTFRWLGVNDGLSPEFVTELLEGQLKHAREADLDIDSLDFTNPTALVIEDFGTKGLTGKINEKDNDNFSDFWRRHGKSHKTGRSRGRWGLGKLVYSTASRAGVFFGVTFRESDKIMHLMGQTVLNLRTVDGNLYPPHAFFSDFENKDDALKRIPVPVKDTDLVSRFVEQFHLGRNGRTGLSVISLFPDAQLNRDRMIGVAIANYFYPLITSQLGLQFNEIQINHNNVREMAKQYAANEFDQIDHLFDFIDDVYMAESESLPRLNDSWSDDRKLDADDFSPDLLDEMKTRFLDGELVGLTLPITITRKNGEKNRSRFSIYLKRPDNLEKGRDIYVRGGLTLPEESKFRERRALGALIAEDEHICGLLGDAENAAHTRWTTNTEKLRKNYRSSQHIVTVIKTALVSLYDLLVEEIEETDEQALKDFFWYEEAQVGKKKRSTTPKPVIPPLPKRPQLFTISQTKDGFHVHSTEHLTTDKLPIVLNLQVAYDVVQGNPYNKYSPLDFKFGRNGNITVTGTKETIKTLTQKENLISAEVSGLPFKIECLGFDPNRDIKIRLTTENP